MDRSPPVSSDHGILQARIQEKVAMSSSKGSSQPSAVAGGFFTTSTTWEAHCWGKSLKIPNYDFWIFVFIISKLY